jgi:hypothetical protein
MAQHLMETVRGKYHKYEIYKNDDTFSTTFSVRIDGEKWAGYRFKGFNEAYEWVEKQR